MEKGFIKNEVSLKESHEVEDLFGISVEIEQFKKKISSINSPSIIGLVGPFGVGKSTMLFQVQKEAKKDDVWVNFDAWKYPDRQELWEGFVLDFAKQISPKDFQEADNKIKGKQNEDKRTLIRTLSRIPGFAVLEGLNHFFETSPARRVDEIHKILQEQINKVTGDLYITVEDIDRSGDSGIFFLETMKQFVSGIETNKKLVVIVPMSEKSYYSKIDSYLKSVDYFEFFNPSKFNLERFVEDIFDPELFKGVSEAMNSGLPFWTGINRKTQTTSFLEGLFNEQSEMSPRLLKLILRKANLTYKNQINDGLKPDFRVTLCFEASKYFSISNDSEQKYFNDFKKRKSVIRGNIFSSFLISMFRDKSSIYEETHTANGEKKVKLLESPQDFKIIEHRTTSQEFPSFPWSGSDYSSDDKRSLYLTDFYIKY